MKIKSMDVINDERFLRARGSELAKLQAPFPDGTVLKPRVKGKKVVGFTAEDKMGRPVPLVSVRVKGRVAGARRETIICLKCRCKGRSCKCIPIKCPIEA